jgi:hypothetical protein
MKYLFFENAHSFVASLLDLAAINRAVLLYNRKASLARWQYLNVDKRGHINSFSKTTRTEI